MTRQALPPLVAAPAAMRPRGGQALPGRPLFQALPPLSLYVHFPWCVRKCPYCDFNSHGIGAGGDVPEARYLEALAQDLERTLPMVWGRRVHTVFIGGGTPSLMSEQAADRLLSELRARLPLDADAEITLEANPGTAEASRFAAYRASGVNRLSLGIQSFDGDHLRSLGRIHDGDAARRAVELVARTFDNFNLDLMFALPRQTLAGLEADLDVALSFEPPHLSLYHLTLEPNTEFAKYPPPLPDDDLAADMQTLIEERLTAAGYEHYEVSAWARPGRRAAHNLNYWRFGDYIGIGAGAHGKISLPDRVLRTEKPRNPESYMVAAASGGDVGTMRECTATELPFEFMLNALRLTEGFAVPLFGERTGLALSRISGTLDEAERRGLIERDHARIGPSERGRAFLNDLLQMFL